LVVQLQDLVAGAQRVVVLEGARGQRPVGVIDPAQEAGRFRVGDAHRVVRVEHGRADVIGMHVAVDDMRDRLAGYFTDGAQDVVPDGRRGIYGDHTLAGREEHHLVDAVGQVVEAGTDLLDQVPLAGY